MSDLRSFRMKKSEGKVANGRKRIRMISDSSDDEQATVKQAKTAGDGNGTGDVDPVKQKEESLHVLRQITNSKIDFMVLQDVLARCEWDAQRAYNELEKDPKYGPRLSNSPVKFPSPLKDHSPAASSKIDASPSPEKVEHRVSRVFSTFPVWWMKKL